MVVGKLSPWVAGEGQLRRTGTDNRPLPPLALRKKKKQEAEPGGLGLEKGMP